MIINQVPEAEGLQSLKSKELIQKFDQPMIGIADRSPGCRLCFPCWVKEKYQVFETNNQKMTDKIIYEIEEESSNCCSKNFTVKDTESSIKVGDFKVTNDYLCLPCCGHTLEATDYRKAEIGYSVRPCQCFNSGVEIKKRKESSSDYYIGSNKSCCSGFYSMLCWPLEAKICFFQSPCDLFVLDVSVVLTLLKRQYWVKREKKQSEAISQFTHLENLIIAFVEHTIVLLNLLKLMLRISTT